MYPPNSMFLQGFQTSMEPAPLTLEWHRDHAVHSPLPSHLGAMPHHFILKLQGLMPSILQTFSSHVANGPNVLILLTLAHCFHESYLSLTYPGKNKILLQNVFTHHTQCCALESLLFSVLEQGWHAHFHLLCQVTNITHLYQNSQCNFRVCDGFHCMQG